MREHFLSKVVDRVNELLRATNRAEIDFSQVLFVWESEIDYGVEPPAVRSDVMSDAKGFEHALVPELAAGPSWVHANLLSTDAGIFLIAIGLGANIGNPRPSINVSYEDKQVRVFHVPSSSSRKPVA